MSTALSVNVNKIAWLRNAREGDQPNVLKFSKLCIDAGCHGITVHPRPDLRHIRPHDVLTLAEALAADHPKVEYNIEGNPFEGPNDQGYPGYLELVEQARPAQATLVPDLPGQLTSDHGFTPTPEGLERLEPIVSKLKSYGARVSVFVDAGIQGLDGLAKIGVDRVELYTGPYAEAFAKGDNQEVQAWLERYAQTANQARALGLGINAGHDLNQLNLTTLLQHLDPVDEVSIGHALISDALEDGLVTTVKNYLKLVA